MFLIIFLVLVLIVSLILSLVKGEIFFSLRFLRFSWVCIVPGPNFNKTLEFKSNLRTSLKRSFSGTFISNIKKIPEKLKGFMNWWAPWSLKPDLLALKTWKKWKTKSWMEISHHSQPKLRKVGWALVIFLADWLV